MAAGVYVAWQPRDAKILIQGLISVPESASLTAKRGTPGLWDANGRAAAVGASPASIGFIFAEDGHNGTAGANNVLVIPLRTEDLWIIPITNAMAQNQFGLVDFGVVKDATTSYWYGDSGDAGAQFRPVDYITGPAGFVIGDTKWLAIGKFHSTKIQVF